MAHQRTPGWSERGQTIARAAVAAALALGAGASGAGTLPAVDEPGVPPEARTRVTAAIHQLRSSAGRPYTLFEYAVPTPGAVPHILAIDGADRVWFSESGGQFARNFIDLPPGQKVGRLDGDGAISEWVLGEGTSPMGVVFDARGDLWISERLGNRIRRLRRGGGFEAYPLPKPRAWPTGIAVDSRGRIWFTETRGDKVGVLDPDSGELREHPLPVRGAMATGIAVDRKDRIWIALRDVNAIGRLDPATGEIRSYTLPTPEAKPCGVTVAPDGTVWFSERNGGKIGTIQDDGTIREIALADRFSGPFLLAVDRRGDVWFTELFAHRVSRLDPRTERIESFAVPGDPSHPAGLALDSKGNVWFAQQTTNRLAVIVRTDLDYLAGESRAGGPAPAAAQSAPFRFDEWEVPTPQAIPGIVGVDRHDTVWFTQMGGGWVGPGFPPGPPGGKIGFVRDGQIHEIATPTPGSGPTSLALDPCGDDVWVTLRSANGIARVRDGTITEIEVPVPEALPVGIAVDYDHNVWVALSAANKLGRRSPTGEWRFLDLPEAGAEPRTIYVDPSNQVWFAEKMGNHIGRVDKEAWRVERWPIPTRLAWPLSLISDSEGRLWFAEMRSDKLGRFDPRTGRIDEFSLPVQSAPFKLLYDPENAAMWVSTVFYNAILRFDLGREEVTGVYKVPSEGAWVGGLDRDSRNCIWFSEQFANRIGRLCIDGVAAPAVEATAASRP